MKPITIKVCGSNESAKYKEQILQILAPYEHTELLVEKCLNRCSFCEDTPYVLINNGVEFGDDITELLENIEDTVSSLHKK